MNENRAIDGGEVVYEYVIYHEIKDGINGDNDSAEELIEITQKEYRSIKHIFSELAIGNMVRKQEVKLNIYPVTEFGDWSKYYIAKETILSELEDVPINAIETLYDNQSLRTKFLFYDNMVFRFYNKDEYLESLNVEIYPITRAFPDSLTLLSPYDWSYCKEDSGCPHCPGKEQYTHLVLGNSSKNSKSIPLVHIHGYNADPENNPIMVEIGRIRE